MTAQAELLSEIEAFIASNGMAPTTFGVLAVNDGKLVGRLRRNANMNLATLDKVRAFMRAAERARNSAPHQGNTAHLTSPLASTTRGRSCPAKYEV